MTSAWTLDEVSDRLQIQQLLVDYATAIDTRQFDDLDEVFTNDAYIDYRAMGGIDGEYPDVKAWLAQVLPAFPMYARTCWETCRSLSIRKVAQSVPLPRSVACVSTRWCPQAVPNRCFSSGFGTTMRPCGPGTVGA